MQKFPENRNKSNISRKLHQIKYIKYHSYLMWANSKLCGIFVAWSLDWTQTRNRNLGGTILLEIWNFIMYVWGLSYRRKRKRWRLLVKVLAIKSRQITGYFFKIFWDCSTKEISLASFHEGHFRWYWLENHWLNS